MAEQADVYVKHLLAGVTDDINVIRRLQDGSIDLEVTIAKWGEESINLNGTDVSLTIQAPASLDIMEHPIEVRSDVDLGVSCSRTNANWILKIIPNSLPPGAPTDVNVHVGADEPDEPES